MGRRKQGKCGVESAAGGYTSSSVMSFQISPTVSARTSLRALVFGVFSTLSGTAA
jgi:hypothetical protein